MDHKDRLHEAVEKRYEKESETACSLGCGTVLSDLAVAAGESILDLGCGRGAETLEAARLAGPAGKATGLDLTEAMVQTARQEAAKAGVANAFFVTGDIEALPFGNDTFDGAISNCVINHARDKSRVFREIHRVLKPGGRFVISDATTRLPLPEEVRKDPEAWAQCFGGAVTTEEYLESVRGAGFAELEILARREYIKNGYDFISITIKAVK